MEVFHFVESSRIRVNFSQWVKGKFQQRKKGANFGPLNIPTKFKKIQKATSANMVGPTVRVMSNNRTALL